MVEIRIPSMNMILIMLFALGVLSIETASAQLPPEIAPSEQQCEQMEISNRLYNPVTITLGYDRATQRTPEVIVSKSNPDAIVPVTILETTANIFTNTTGRFVAKFDMQFANPSDQPRFVSYNILSGKFGQEFERGAWRVLGQGFCKVITFTVTEEPHIPTFEEMRVQVKDAIETDLQKNREEQLKTNDLITMLIVVFIGVGCAIIIGIVIWVLIKRQDGLNAKTMLNHLTSAKKRLDNTNELMKLSNRYNDLMSQRQRQLQDVKLDKEIDWIEKSFGNMIAQVKNHLDKNIRDLAFAFDSALRNNRPLEYNQPVLELTMPEKPEQVHEEQKKITDGMAGIFDKVFDSIPDVSILKNMKEKVRPTKEPETFEEWYEFYNKISSYEDLSKIYNEKLNILEKDTTNEKLVTECNALNVLMQRRA